MDIKLMITYNHNLCQMIKTEKQKQKLMFEPQPGNEMFYNRNSLGQDRFYLAAAAARGLGTKTVSSKTDFKFRNYNLSNLK